MTEKETTPTASEASPSLKLLEPDVLQNDPWHDDVLGRKEIANRLTNLISTQSVPFVVSVHGAWGTGKTFMLKRWQKDLEGQGFQAIYFNAWEDDFCDDPLLAILGQLSEYFQEGKTKEIAARIVKALLPLIRQNVLGILKSHTGVTLELDEGNQNERDFLKEYVQQRSTKIELKGYLAEISGEVLETTKHPLVFIIDELDRCRPTFAIELLERVKHIFDVPNLVFVLGINREELGKSLQSVYGEIDADVYLRRFFDMEFILPEVDSQVFCKHLLEKFDIQEFFESMSVSANTSQHHDDLQQFQERIPELWSYFGLSLRDIDYCVRLISLACRSLKPSDAMYPWLIGLLIALKFNNQDLYRRIVRGECLASEVIDYVHSLIPEDDGYTDIAHTLSLIEGFLYVLELKSARHPRNATASSQFYELLNRRKTLDELAYPERLSARMKEAFEIREKGALSQGDGPFVNLNTPEASRIDLLTEALMYAQRSNIPQRSLEQLAETIDLHQGVVRR